jgi:MerR family transcriptional regulator/heat shock protein HspR
MSHTSGAQRVPTSGGQAQAVQADGTNLGHAGRERDRSMAVYVISVAAELAGVHPQTLRIYERKGLLGPARTLGGSRRYSDEDIALLRRIQDLTAAGLNLEGVKRVIELESEVERLRGEVERARVEARRAVEEVHRQYRRELVPLNMSPTRWLPQLQ